MECYFRSTMIPIVNLEKYNWDEWKSLLAIWMIRLLLVLKRLLLPSVTSRSSGKELFLFILLLIQLLYYDTSDNYLLYSQRDKYFNWFLTMMIYFSLIPSLIKSLLYDLIFNPAVMDGITHIHHDLMMYTTTKSVSGRDFISWLHPWLCDSWSPLWYRTCE